MKTRSLLLPLLALLSACATTTTPSAPTAPREIKTSGPYTHASGMVFPEEVGSFRRVEITAFPDQANNVGIGYNLGDPPAAIVTVFVYPSGGQPFEAHFAQVVNDVVRVHQAPPTQQSPVEVVQDGKTIEGKAATWQFSEKSGSQTMLLHSRLFLFERGPWFVKYRITNAALADGMVREQTDELLEALALPPG